MKPFTRVSGYSSHTFQPWGNDATFYHLTIEQWRRRDWLVHQGYEWYWQHLNFCQTWLYRYLCRFLQRHDADPPQLAMSSEEAQHHTRWRDTFVGWTVQQDFDSYDRASKGTTVHRTNAVTEAVYRQLFPEPPAPTRSQKRLRKRLKRGPVPRPTTHISTYPSTNTLHERFMDGIQPINLLQTAVDPPIVFDMMRSYGRGAQAIRAIELGIYDDLRAAGHIRYSHEPPT